MLYYYWEVIDYSTGEISVFENKDDAIKFAESDLENREIHLKDWLD